MREAGANLAALRIAATEFFEEGFAFAAVEDILRNTSPEHLEEAERVHLPRRQSADGLFDWLHHLIWLEGALEVQPSLMLTAVELQGLQVLRRARHEFERTHPRCPQCSNANDRYDFRCRSCGAELNPH